MSKREFGRQRHRILVAEGIIPYEIQERHFAVIFPLTCGLGWENHLVGPYVSPYHLNVDGYLQFLKLCPNYSRKFL
jgi:hypothetical protein